MNVTHKSESSSLPPSLSFFDTKLLFDRRLFVLCVMFARACVAAASVPPSQRVAPYRPPPPL